MHTILEVHHILNSLFYEDWGRVHIAGGCIRDIIWGKDYKDIDAFVFMPDDMGYDTADKLLNTICHNISQDYSKLLEYCTDTLDSDAAEYMASDQTTINSFNERVQFVIKLKYKPTNTLIDVIVSRKHNIHELLDSFDCNFNKCALDEALLMPYGARVTKLEWCIPNLSSKRKKHIQDKFNLYMGDNNDVTNTV